MAKKSHTAKYVGVYVGLLVLTTTSLLLSFVTKGHSGVAIAYAIALVKGSLVAWFFMHLSEETWSSRLAMVFALLMVVLLAGLVVGDIAERPLLGIHVPPAR